MDFFSTKFDAIYYPWNYVITYKMWHIMHWNERLRNSRKTRNNGILMLPNVSYCYSYWTIKFWKKLQRHIFLPKGTTYSTFGLWSAFLQGWRCHGDCRRWRLHHLWWDHQTYQVPQEQNVLDLQIPTHCWQWLHVGGMNSFSIFLVSLL